VSVVLRLARVGKHKSPAYRIVATDRQSRRDGRFLQVVGTYNPLKTPAAVTLKEELIKKWLGEGALPSSVVRRIIMKQIPGLIEAREDHKRAKIRDARKKRKARAASAGGAKAEKPAEKAAAPKAPAEAKAAEKA
jgi:small subunit ribosomal protein S16